MEAMTGNRAEVRDFLVTRRAKITPEQAGLQFYGRNRRVPGLRREEIAMLAGVSGDYYTRLEKAIFPAYPTASSTPSPAHSSSTKPSGTTCSTSPAPPTPARPAPLSAGPPSRSAPQPSSSSTA